ncbi:MAG: PD-(D/E)XK nuclease family protein [Dehalococcoidia bacterium]|nr:PD-(D/E)XK nuclease family protein [Dehalococcoidia bacterium]
MWQNFQSLSVKKDDPSQSRRRYSVTADILAYQQCSIQYGAFAARQYEPALAVQLFYGTIVHQVLDRAHSHYRGELGAPQGILPTDADIESYFIQVENALRARKIRAVQNVRDQALKVLQRFNSLEGPSLYPRVITTECRLQTNQSSYILHGNVDVLAYSDTMQDDQVEIWDYKGAWKPSLGDPEYQRYLFQMQVYADLYRQQTGITPTKAVLYFLNELALDPAPQVRPVNALIEVTLDPTSVLQALQSFENTVQEIEDCRRKQKWPEPVDDPGQPTCDACDLRWNCTAATKFDGNRHYSLTYP